MTQKALEIVSYRIDHEDNIVSVFDNWIEAAEEGNNQELQDVESVLDTSIFDHLNDESTKSFYKLTFEQCRKQNKAVELDYRCDSPTEKRFMKMRVIPLPDRSLNIHNYLLKTERFRAPVIIKPYDVSSNKKPVLRCSLCNSLKLPTAKHWIDPGYINVISESYFSVIHAICPDCKKKFFS